MSSNDPILLRVSRDLLAQLGTRTEDGRKLTVTALKEIERAVEGEPVYGATITASDTGELVRPREALDEDALRAELIARFSLKLTRGENVAQIVDWAFNSVRDDQLRAALRGQPETPEPGRAPGSPRHHTEEPSDVETTPETFAGMVAAILNNEAVRLGYDVLNAEVLPDEPTVIHVGVTRQEFYLKVERHTEEGCPVCQHREAMRQQIKADSDAQEARMDALAAKRAERKPTEDYDDHIRQWLEDFIDYGVSIGKFATVDDAPNIDAYFETLDSGDEVERHTEEATDGPR